MGHVACARGALRLRRFVPLQPAGTRPGPERRREHCCAGRCGPRARHVRRHSARRALRAAGVALARPSYVRVSLVCLSVPPLLTSLLLLFIAASTRWFPAGGMTSADATTLAWLRLDGRRGDASAAAGAGARAADSRHVRAAPGAVDDRGFAPAVHLAAVARGLSARDVVLRHAWRVSLRPICGVYGLAIGALLSGSFVVEFVTAWPGLGRFDVRGASRARHLSRGWMRGDGRTVSGRWQRDRRLAAGRGGSTRPRTAGAMKRAGLWLLAAAALVTHCRAVARAESRPTAGIPVRCTRRPPPFTCLTGRRGRRSSTRSASSTLSSGDLKRTRLEPVPLRWFTDGRLVTVPEADGGPLLLLGADSLGRDTFSRLLYSARTSLGLALIGTLGALLVGALVGGLAGYAGGAIDHALSQVYRLRPGAAGDLCGAGAARRHAAGPAARDGVRAAGVDIRAARLADRGARRARHRGI